MNHPPPVNEAAAPPERLVGTASHVCEILDCFTPAAPARTLTEVAAALGLRKSSVHRLLRTLVVHRYLAFESDGRRYRLGERIAGCARVYAGSSTVTSRARAYLERLRDETNETVSLQTRIGDERHVLAQIEGRESVRVVIDEHRAYPLAVGAAGHLLRAYSADWTNDREAEKLAGIRADGFAVTRAELVKGAIAIYVPVLEDDSGMARLVVGAQAPEFRVPASKVRTMIAILREVAGEIAAVIAPGTPLR